MSKVAHDLRIASLEATALLAAIKDIIGNDEELALTAVEGETDLYEIGESAIDRIVELKALRHGLSERIADMKARLERFKAQEDNIRDALLDAMQSIGQQKLELPVATISESRLADKLEITDETKVPAKFWYQPPPPDPKLNNDLILETLKSGVGVEGCVLVTNRRSIGIRMK